MIDELLQIFGNGMEEYSFLMAFVCTVIVTAIMVQLMNIINMIFKSIGGF